MFNIERWKEIFQSIQKNKLRTALSGFTVSLGILIFIILFGLGEGLKNSYSDLFLNEANNVIFIYPGKTTKPYGGFKTNRQIELKNEDVDAIMDEFSETIEYVNPTIRYGDAIRYKFKYFFKNCSAEIEDQGYHSIRESSLKNEAKESSLAYFEYHNRSKRPKYSGK